MGTTSSVQGMRYRDYTAQKTQNHRCQYRKEQTSTQKGQWTEPKEDSFQGADVWYILYQYDALHRLRTRHWSLHLRVLSLREGNAVKPWAQDCSPTGYSSLTMWISKLLGDCFNHIKAEPYSPKNSYFSQSHLPETASCSEAASCRQQHYGSPCTSKIPLQGKF